MQNPPARIRCADSVPGPGSGSNSSRTIVRVAEGYYRRPSSSAMMKWSHNLKNRETAPALFVSAVAIVVLLLLRATGGANSDLNPLIYLPVILAVVSCSFEVTVGLGVV